MSVPSLSSNGKPPALRFGVIGSFPGDDARLAAALRLQNRLLQGAVSTAVFTSQVRDVLSSLPMNGRVEFCAKSLLSADMPTAVQEQNSALILQLFRECFDAVESSSTLSEVSASQGKSAAQDDAADQSSSRPDVDDWVIVSLCTGPVADSAGEELSSPEEVVGASRPNVLLYLKSEGYYVLRALVAALPSFGSVSVALFDEYFSRTTSTVFRRQFIKAMVALPTSLFSDERLERVYHSSVEAVRRVIESECKQHNGLRAAFLSRLIISGATNAANELIHHATSELLEEHLLRSVQTASEPTISGRVLSVVNQDWLFKANWMLHADVYLRFLSVRLEAHKSDPLWCGSFLNDFYSLLLSGGAVSALPSAVALLLFDMYTTFRPLTVNATVPIPVKQLLFELSKQGALCGSDDSASTEDVAYAGVNRVTPPTLVLRAMSSEEKWKALNSMLVRTPHGMAFPSPLQELCETLLKGFANKSSHHHDVGVLAQQVIAALSSSEFRRMVFDAAGHSLSQTARTCRTILNAALAIKSTRFSQPVLQAWLQQHLDNTPDKLQEHALDSSEEELWGKWCKSICGVIQPRLTVIASKAVLALETNSVRATRSQITSYVGYAALLSERLLLVLQRCAHAIPPPQLLQTALWALDLLGRLVNGNSLAPLYPPANDQQQQHTGERSIAHVRSVGDSVALLAVFSLQRGLDFDVSSPQCAQLSAPFLTTQLSQLSTATNLDLFPALGPALFTFHKHLLHVSQLSAEVQQRGFIMVAPKKDQRASVVAGEGEKASQITWVYVNSAHHLQCAALAMDELEQLCVQARAIPALEQTAHEAWKLVRPRYFSASLTAAETLQNVTEFRSFLAACGKLPSSVAEAEKPLLLSALVHHLQANSFRNVAMGSGLNGWWTFLLAAVDACGAEWLSRNSWLLQFQNISLAPVRECLQQATQDREPQNRQQAYLHLLSVSMSTSWREFVQSVEYVQRRTKNEAGLYRRDIYQRIASCIPAVVSQSLNSAGARSAGFSEEEALASVHVITESLTQILRDDLSKRDSVAKGVFRGLGHTLITAAISHVAPPLLSIRHTWITCGQTLDLLLLHAASGEGAGRHYVWPIAGTVFPHEHWITEDALTGAVRKAVVTGFRGGEHVFSTLSQQVYSTKQHVHVAPAALYTPEQAVDLLCSIMTAQGADSPTCAADHLIDGAFFPAGDAATTVKSMGVATCESSTLRCMQQLYRFCGARWTSVPRLVSFFEQVVSTVADPSRAAHPLFASHYRQTYSLFHTVRQLYADGAAWYELVPLSRACTELFALAIHRGEATDAQVLCPLWTEMRMHQGKIHTCGDLSLSDLSFLVANVVPMRGRQAVPVLASATKTECFQADAADTHKRAATRLRDILALSPSALHLVWSELISSRDDIFSLYQGRTSGELAGVFKSSPANQPLKATEEMAYFPITSAQLVSLNAHAMQTFTRMCMQRAMDRSLSASERSQAITQFVQSPAASHHDVIAVLRKLQAVVASRNQKDREAKTALASVASASGTDSTRETVVDDDAADLLLESVILRVFDTDATWFVLAFLLDPKTISSAPQRTTATIVTNLRLWAPVDRTVAVLRVLLEPGRRWAIGHFLHKQILRLLFECSDHHALARELFITEWKQRGAEMPKDVCHEVVKLAVSALNDRNEFKQALAWSIVDDLIIDANMNNMDPATLVLLLTPAWQPGGDDSGHMGLSTLLRDTCPPRRQTIGGVEAPDSFGHVHSLLTAEPVFPFSTSTRHMCERMAALMSRLSVVSQNQHVRVLSQLQQFAFSSNMAGEADDETMDQLRQLLLQSTVEAAVMAETPSKAFSGVVLDITSEWAISVISRLYAGLSTQVLARALTATAASTPADVNPCTRLCQHHPYATRLKGSVGTLLQSMLNTPPAQAERRFRVAKALMAIVMQLNQTPLPTLPSKVTKPTTWLVELIGAPFGDLLDFIRRDSLQSANLVQNVGR